MQVHTVLWKCTLCWESAHHAVKVHTVLWKCTLCYESAHCAERMHTMLWKCTLCYESAQCAVRVQTVLWKCTPWYVKCTPCCESAHHAVRLHTLIWKCTPWYVKCTPCYESAHHAVRVHTVLWQCTLCCQHNIQQFTIQTHTSFKWQYSVQSTITKILNTHAFYTVRFEVLKAVLLSIHIFWDGSLCRRVSDCWSFNGLQCLGLQGRAVFQLKMNMLRNFAMYGSTHTATLCHIPQNLNPPFMLILNFYRSNVTQSNYLLYMLHLV